jgi:hypothetical protein
VRVRAGEPATLVNNERNGETDMGGLGSGRWNWHRKKTPAEHCRWFTVAVLVGDQPPAAGRAAKLVWAAVGGVESELAFAFTTRHTAVLAYGWGTGADRKEFAYPLDLVGLPTPNGGIRYLARCPLSVNGVRCPRRVAKLYQPPRSPYFGCRFCHQLTYRSRQAHDPRVSALLRGGVDRLCELAQNPSRLPIPVLGLILTALTEWERRSERAMKRLDPKTPPRRRKT